MKLEKWTIEVLKNFQDICPSIVLRPGKELRTISVSETVFARAVVEDEFPITAGIYNMQKFISLLEMDKNESPTLDFQDKQVTITSPYGSCLYTYSDVSLIKNPPTEGVSFDDIVTSFDFTSDKFEVFKKAMNILASDCIVIEANGENLQVRTHNSKDRFADTYVLDICECDKTFSAIMEMGRLDFIKNDYNVSINPNSVRFRAMNLTNGKELEYYVGLHKDSKVE